MGDWPDGLKVAPLREWPGTLRAPANRQRAKFKRPGHFENGKWVDPKPMPLSATLDDLDRELFHLRARDVELLVAIDPSRFRVDGKPYSNAIADHPGVVLSFEIPKVSRVSYPCDKYTRWEDNLRAVALALEALRLIDRHGVTRHHEQYRGFLAIEATAAPKGFTDLDEVDRFLGSVIGHSSEGLDWKQMLRRAQAAAHPDRGGDPAIFQRVSLAEAFLRKEGAL